MADRFNEIPTIEILESGPKEEFNFASDGFRADAEAQYGLGLRLALHEGRMSGLEAAMQATQSALSSAKQAFGAWTAVVIGTAALLVGGGAVLIGLVQFNTGTLRDDVQAVEARVLGVESGFEALAREVDTLPSRVGAEMRETARDLVLISAVQGSAQQPPAPPQAQEVQD